MHDDGLMGVPPRRINEIVHGKRAIRQIQPFASPALWGRLSSSGWDYKPTTIWKKHARRLRTNLRRLNMSRR